MPRNHQKKVLILTLCGYLNYGNRLQNYALTNTLRNMGCSVKTACYYSFKHKAFDFVSLGLPFLRLNKENPRLYRFSKKYMSPDYFFNTSIDCVVVGSDQVWNPDYLQKHDIPINPYYEGAKIVSYAASIGKSNLSPKDADLLKKYLPLYSAISVRESTAATQVRDFVDKNVKVVLDPTLLLTASDWSRVASRAHNNQIPNEKYIFCYILGKNTNLSPIKEYANKNGLKMFTLSDRDNRKYGAEEFLSLIKNSELICTDSFHACVFSFIFNKPFFVFKRDGKEELYARITNFLHTLKINGREYNKSSFRQSITHDYTNSYKTLEKLRRDSLNFLKDEVVS